MMSPTILWLLFCLSVPYANCNSSEESSEEVVGNARQDLNNLSGSLEESNNPSDLNENLSLEKTPNDDDNSLNSLSSSNLLNRLNLHVPGDVGDSNSLRNLRSNLNSADGVYDFTNHLNHLSTLNFLSSLHGLEGVNNPVVGRSAVVGRNGHNPYEDGSVLSALLALNRLGLSQNRGGDITGLNVLAQTGLSSSVDLDSLENASSDLLERNDHDELLDDLEGESKQGVSVSLNKLREDNRRGLVKPVRLDKAQLVGRSGSVLDEDNLLNALESHNGGELNALSALATISNLDDFDDLSDLLNSKSLLDTNNLDNSNVESSSVESESDNLNELGNLNRVQESLLSDEDSLETEPHLQSRYPEEEVHLDQANNRRSGYLNNDLLNSLRLLNGRNRGFDEPLPVLPYNRPVLPYNRPVSLNPYRYYDELPLNPLLLNNQRNVGVSPYRLRGRSGLKTNDNLNAAEEFSAGLEEENDSKGVDENTHDKLVDLDDYDVDNLLDFFNKNELNAVSLVENELQLRSPQQQSQEDGDDYDNFVIVVDANDVNDLKQVEVDILSGRRMLSPSRRLNSAVDVNDADVLSNLENLNTNAARRQRPKNNKNTDSLTNGLNNNLAHDKIGKLHGVLKLTQEEELTLEEAKQLVAKGLTRSGRRHF